MHWDSGTISVFQLRVNPPGVLELWTLGVRVLSSSVVFNGGDININDGSVLLSGMAFLMPDGGKLRINGVGVATFAGPFFATDEGSVLRKVGVGGFDFGGSVEFVIRGTVAAEEGVLTMQQSTLYNYEGGTLSNGEWLVFDGATLDLAGVSITTLDASVSLLGSGASFPALSSLERNEGTLVLRDGATLTLAASSFVQAGTLDLGPGSVLSLAGSYSSLGGSSTVVRLGDASVGEAISAVGGLMLDGGLRVVFEAFTPSGPEVVPVAAGASRLGMFDLVEFEDVPGGYACELLYSGTGVGALLTSL